jgi:hypothetical protein
MRQAGWGICSVVATTWRLAQGPLIVTSCGALRPHLRNVAISVAISEAYVAGSRGTFISGKRDPSASPQHTTRLEPLPIGNSSPT